MWLDRLRAAEQAAGFALVSLGEGAAEDDPASAVFRIEARERLRQSEAPKKAAPTVRETAFGYFRWLPAPAPRAVA